MRNLLSVAVLVLASAPAMANIVIGIPEPSTYALFAAAGVAAVVLRRRAK